jgi:hypothetical protein
MYGKAFILQRKMAGTYVEHACSYSDQGQINQELSKSQMYRT